MTTYNEINSILIGEAGVGKTSLLSRFKCGGFNAHHTTTPVNYCLKTTNIRGKDVRHSIRDLSGKEEHRSLIMGYYDKADGILLVYDVRKLKTFEKLSEWITDFRSINNEAEVILVGNKSENPENKIVAISVLKKFAREQRLSFAEVSAKSGENVSEVFNYLTESILIGKGLLLPTYNRSILELEMASKKVPSPIATTQQRNDDEMKNPYNSSEPLVTTQVSQESPLLKTTADETIKLRKAENKKHLTEEISSQQKIPLTGKDLSPEEPDNCYESYELSPSNNRKKYATIVESDVRVEKGKRKCCVIL